MLRAYGRNVVDLMNRFGEVNTFVPALAAGHADAGGTQELSQPGRAVDADVRLQDDFHRHFGAPDTEGFQLLRRQFCSH